MFKMTATTFRMHILVRGEVQLYFAVGACFCCRLLMPAKTTPARKVSSVRRDTPYQNIHPTGSHGSHPNACKYKYTYLV